jgi:hypothetical protein
METCGPELEPTHRREALKTIFETIARLTGTGLIVAAGCDAMRLVTAGSPEPFGIDVLRVVVSKAEQPRLFAVREITRRLSSPKGDQAPRNPQGSNQGASIPSRQEFNL